MRVFAITNILIDFVCGREEYVADAEKLFALGCMGRVQLMTLSLSYVTTMYVAHKYGYQKVKETLRAISEFVEVVDLKGETIKQMLSSDWIDYEDAVQNASALYVHADCIVTRNKKDYTKSILPIYSISELFNIL